MADQEIVITSEPVTEAAPEPETTTPVNVVVDVMQVTPEPEPEANEKEEQEKWQVVQNQLTDLTNLVTELNSKMNSMIVLEAVEAEAEIMEAEADSPALLEPESVEQEPKSKPKQKHWLW